MLIVAWRQKYKSLNTYDKKFTIYNWHPVAPGPIYATQHHGRGMVGEYEFSSCGAVSIK